jgi:tetratricopeptide (TPR) repeat protein
MTKQYKKAVASLEETVQMFPGYAAAYINLADGLLHVKQFDRAAVALQRALELEPNNDIARYNLGVAYLAAKNKSAALEQYAILKRTDETRAQQLYELMFGKHILSAKSN